MKKGLPLPLVLTALLAILGVAVLGCTTPDTHTDRTGLRPYTTADTTAAVRATFPKYITAEVRDGYQYALTRPDVLQYLPCYCGCGLNKAHRNNLDCFVAGVAADGTIRFDDHAAYCDICLQIARDAQRLIEEGKTLAQVRAYVDQAHGEKGPGTDTPWPPQ